LNDIQIRELLLNDELKIIPLIDFDKQRGSTSIDLRLGPSFQIYQPNQSGVIDFTDNNSVENVVSNSSILDLDYLGSIVLAPGQFVLAHTMEYMALPPDVAGQLEGRSSFARLGIQVHMTANMIDPGFHGAITFEILNAGPNPIRLYPGYRIGQLRLFKCVPPAYPYNLKGHAKYKGLLAHSSTLLAKDYEIRRIRDAIGTKKQ
jgi:dCTP deaminase